MQTRRHQSLSGFTLIELLIAVAISITIVSVGIAALRRSAARSVLAAESGKLLTELRRIQVNAITGTKPASGCGTLKAYELEFGLSDGLSYFRSRPDCDPTAIPWTDSSVVKKNLPSVIAVVTNPVSSLRFKVLTQGAAPAMRICLLDTQLQKKYELVVTQTGEIRNVGLSKAAYISTCDAP